MLEASYILIAAKDKIERTHDDFMPRLHDVRRVAVRYQRMLPLTVMKKHQCVVLGATQHMLTVGIIERKDRYWIQTMQTLTGMIIFPVLVEPERMRLLIGRIERYQRFRQRYSRAAYLLALPMRVRDFFLLCEHARNC
jgi:hypothetical protein